MDNTNDPTVSDCIKLFTPFCAQCNFCDRFFAGTRYGFRAHHKNSSCATLLPEYRAGISKIMDEGMRQAKHKPLSEFLDPQVEPKMLWTCMVCDEVSQRHKQEFYSRHFTKKSAKCDLSVGIERRLCVRLICGTWIPAQLQQKSLYCVEIERKQRQQEALIPIAAARVPDTQDTNTQNTAVTPHQVRTHESVVKATIHQVIATHTDHGAAATITVTQDTNTQETAPRHQVRTQESVAEAMIHAVTATRTGTTDAVTPYLNPVRNQDIHPPPDGIDLMDILRTLANQLNTPLATRLASNVTPTPFQPPKERPFTEEYNNRITKDPNAFPDPVQGFICPSEQEMEAMERTLIPFLHPRDQIGDFPRILRTMLIRCPNFEDEIHSFLVFRKTMDDRNFDMAMKAAEVFFQVSKIQAMLDSLPGDNRSSLQKFGTKHEEQDHSYAIKAYASYKDIRTEFGFLIAFLIKYDYPRLQEFWQLIQQGEDDNDKIHKVGAIPSLLYWLASTSSGLMNDPWIVRFCKYRLFTDYGVKGTRKLRLLESGYAAKKLGKPQE